MIIIYNCFGGTHTSIMASELHLNRLPKDRIPTTEELINTPNFNTLDDRDFGRLIFHGTDECGNDVYSIGRGSSKALIPAMESLITTLHRRYGYNEGFIFVNVSSSVTFPLTFGGLFSRHLKLGFLGDPFVFRGSKASYPKIIKLVEKTKELCRTNKGDFFIIDINSKGQLTRIH